jgi:hypothetical protein
MGRFHLSLGARRTLTCFARILFAVYAKRKYPSGNDENEPVARVGPVERMRCTARRDSEPEGATLLLQLDAEQVNNKGQPKGIGVFLFRIS